MKENFIMTSDLETANQLRALHFQEVESTVSGKYMFLNCKKINFGESEVDSSKVTYTNKFFL